MLIHAYHAPTPLSAILHSQSLLRHPLPETKTAQISNAECRESFPQATHHKVRASTTDRPRTAELTFPNAGSHLSSTQPSPGLQQSRQNTNVLSICQAQNLYTKPPNRQLAVNSQLLS